MNKLTQLWWRCIVGPCTQHPAWATFLDHYPVQRALEYCLSICKIMAVYGVGSLLYAGFQGYSHHLEGVIVWGIVVGMVSLVFLGIVLMTRKSIGRLWQEYLKEHPEKVNQLVMEHILPKAQSSSKPRRL